MLRFLWKWKVATTTALAIKFYPNAKLTSAHRQLLDLSYGGYIQSIASHTGSGFVWTLTNKGFEAIKDNLGELAEVGYKSEAIGHDLLCMAAMIGEWIHEPPPGVVMFSEQQLRRIATCNYPMWVPQSEVHRSDGYWRLPKLSKNGSIALEVERSLKTPSKYDLVADFYEEYDFVNHVLWITPMPRGKSSIAKRIQTYLGRETTKHSFIALDDFTKLGWQAKIATGLGQGKTLSEFMLAFSSPCQRQGESPVLLESRKKPLILDPKNVTSSHSFFN
jgi:hypothetical protein